MIYIVVLLAVAYLFFLIFVIAGLTRAVLQSREDRQPAGTRPASTTPGKKTMRLLEDAGTLSGCRGAVQGASSDLRKERLGGHGNERFSSPSAFAGGSSADDYAGRARMDWGLTESLQEARTSSSPATSLGNPGREALPAGPFLHTRRAG